MWRKQKTATTTARGYGYTHQKARAQAVAAYQPGDPCSRCGRTMWGDPSGLDYDHNDDRTGYRGLAHRHCNRSAGGRKGKQRSQPAEPDFQSRW